MDSLDCNVIRTLRIKCPECLNFMIARENAKGNINGICSVCKSTIIEKQHSNEKLIRIVKQ